MEDILDQLQSDMENELDKVSLERLADLNPELLVNIKQTAEENLRTATNPEAGGGGASDPSQSEALPLYFVETRPSEAIERSKAWMEAATTAGQADAVIGRLRELVEQERTTGFDGARLYTQRQAVEMTQILAGALAAATVLQSATDRMKQEEKESAGGNFSLSGLLPARGHGARATGRYSVDKLSFTNRGVTVRDDAVIGMLYEVGLPFLSSVDGRRFASQGELSAHLDALFRRNQLEKAIARTEERGWFVSDAVWALLKKEEDLSASVSLGLGSDAQAATGDALGDRYDPQTTSVPADETRDRCVVCGINFKMVFDNDDGIYKYINCREIEMLNDDAADMESDEVLVHVTCWRGLGSPPAMTADQALHETLHRYS
jgi:pre-mRNA cleavage complex 2 protein Pcf11